MSKHYKYETNFCIKLIGLAITMLKSDCIDLSIWEIEAIQFFCEIISFKFLQSAPHPNQNHLIF